LDVRQVPRPVKEIQRFTDRFAPRPTKNPTIA
jgi:hypothetical protein